MKLKIFPKRRRRKKKSSYHLPDLAWKAHIYMNITSDLSPEKQFRDSTIRVWFKISNHVSSEETHKVTSVTVLALYQVLFQKLT